MPTLAELAAEPRRAGAPRRRSSWRSCLARIADPQGEGARTYVEVDADGGARGRARDGRAARAPAPSRRRTPASRSRSRTCSTSAARSRARARASLDGAPGDARRRRRSPAGARPGWSSIGRTNMTEFAFSGLGINPHYGTPANPWDRERRRIPGGSSSGAAPSRSPTGWRMARSAPTPAAPAGSPRRSAASSGFKPTQARVPARRDGPALDDARRGRRARPQRRLLRDARRAARAATEPPAAAAARAPAAAGGRRGTTSSRTPSRRCSRRSSARSAGSRDAGAELVDLELPELDEIAGDERRRRLRRRPRASPGTTT